MFLPTPRQGQSGNHTNFVEKAKPVNARLRLRHILRLCHHITTVSSDYDCVIILRLSSDYDSVIRLRLCHQITIVSSDYDCHQITTVTSDYNCHQITIVSSDYNCDIRLRLCHWITTVSSDYDCVIGLRLSSDYCQITDNTHLQTANHFHPDAESGSLTWPGTWWSLWEKQVVTVGETSGQCRRNKWSL